MKNIDRLPFPSLLKEMQDYGQDKALAIKVRRVHLLCLSRDKKYLAKRIFDKYYKHFLHYPATDDRLIAFGWSLAASRK